MKIIRVDNFDREGPNHDDVMICENVGKYFGKIIGEYFGKIITDYLNRSFTGKQSPDFYRLVDNSYKMKKFEP